MTTPLRRTMSSKFDALVHAEQRAHRHFQELIWKSHGAARRVLVDRMHEVSDVLWWKRLAPSMAWAYGRAWETLETEGPQHPEWGCKAAPIECETIDGYRRVALAGADR